MDHNEFYKSTLNKHKKEKDLEKFLYNKEMTNLKQQIKEAKHIKKIEEVKFLSKKRKRDENSSLEKEETFKTKNEEKEKVEDQIELKDALNKIFKHMIKKESFIKCMRLLQTIITNNSNNFFLLIGFKILHKVLSVPFFTTLKTDELERVHEIFEEVEKIITKKNSNDENLENDVNLKSLIQTFQIPIKTQQKLLTDDSFTFSNILKFIEEKYDLLDIYDPEQQEEKEFHNFRSLIDSEEIFEKPNSHLEIDFPILNTYLLRKFIFESIKFSASRSKEKWALPMINSLLKKVYLEKNKFSPEHLEEVGDIINNIKNNKNELLDLNRTTRDGKIKNNPLEASHRVTDARTEQMVAGGFDKWEAKQSGLTYGKMFINN
jgi:hypothetical protein